MDNAWHQASSSTSSKLYQNSGKLQQQGGKSIKLTLAPSKPQHKVVNLWEHNRRTIDSTLGHEKPMTPLTLQVFVRLSLFSSLRRDEVGVFAVFITLAYHTTTLERHSLGLSPSVQTPTTPEIRTSHLRKKRVISYKDPLKETQTFPSSHHEFANTQNALKMSLSDFGRKKKQPEAMTATVGQISCLQGTVREN